MVVRPVLSRSPRKPAARPQLARVVRPGRGPVERVPVVLLPATEPVAHPVRSPLRPVPVVLPLGLVLPQVVLLVLTPLARVPVVPLPGHPQVVLLVP